MRILIIGAGVLGSNLAHSIKKGNDVTILARNKTYENLKNNGLIIKHKLGKKSVDHFNVIDKLDENDIYDVIFVVSRFSSLDSIVKIIEKNKSKNIVFVGNNMNAEKYMNIKDKNILFAFFMAAGKKYDGYINSICLNKIEIGRTDGKDISNEFIKSIFKETKIKLTIENKMNDYLKTHACAVLPLVFASYKVDGNLKLLKKDKEYSLLIMDAIIEGYDVLKKLGYEILPKGEYENCVNKKEKCAFIYRFMFSNFIGKMCISDHAMSAREEFILLDNEFEKLKKKSKLETKVYDKLRLDFLNYDK
ncbi:ketopantoate reductase [Clostridium sp. CAG:433]|nr:ketopantoate reductase [Clostridium sp. CAG:433]